MGTDVRKLVADGYPASNVIGCDLRQEFLDCGYELFQDAGSCGIHFFEDDIFQLKLPQPEAATSTDQPLKRVNQLGQLVGRITHFYTGALFHLFNEYTQYAVALRVAALMKRDPGAIIFGRHQALEEPGMISSSDYPSVLISAQTPMYSPRTQ